jgi:hypothetical protein
VCLFILNYFAQTTFLQRLASWTAIIICLISAFCITACLNEIVLPELLPILWPYPTIKDIILRPYTLCKNLLFRILNKWKKSEPSLQ